MVPGVLSEQPLAPDPGFLHGSGMNTDETAKYEAEEAACPTPLTHNWGRGCPTDQIDHAYDNQLDHLYSDRCEG